MLLALAAIFACLFGSSYDAGVPVICRYYRDLWGSGYLADSNRTPMPGFIFFAWVASMLNLVTYWCLLLTGTRSSSFAYSFLDTYLATFDFNDFWGILYAPVAYFFSTSSILYVFHRFALSRLFWYHAGRLIWFSSKAVTEGAARLTLWILILGCLNRVLKDW